MSKIFSVLLLFCSCCTALAQFPCDCVPATMPSRQERSVAKYADCATFALAKDSINVARVISWDSLYKHRTTGMSDQPHVARLKATPEDTLYALKGYMWFVKRVKGDCDLHIEIGDKDSTARRIIVEVKADNCQLRRKVKEQVERKGEKICKGGRCRPYHFRSGIPVIVIGPGFYDSSHDTDGNHGDVHTRHSNWEIHPAVDIIFL